MKKDYFIFIVDSSLYSPEKVLKELGLPEANYRITGGGGAWSILDRPEELGCKKLLVFMGSFRGNVPPAETLSNKIKEANPNARIIFRSATEHSSDLVFERCIDKNPDVLVHIIQEFLAS